MPATFAGSVFDAERKGEPMQAAAKCLGSAHHHMPALPSAFAQALLCSRAQLRVSLIALIPPSSLQGTEVYGTYSIWLQKVKKDGASLSPPLFIICSGPKAAKYIDVVLENLESCRRPICGLHGIACILKKYN